MNTLGTKLRALCGDSYVETAAKLLKEVLNSLAAPDRYPPGSI